MNYSTNQLNIFNWVSNGSGNAIVIARAGSGKTFTALHAMKKMGGSVISMTLNKKNAVELQEKIATMQLNHCKGSTFHAEGFANLKNRLGHIKVNNSKVYFIADKYLITREERQIMPFVLKMVTLAKQAGFGITGLEPINNTQAWVGLYGHYDVSLDSELGLEDAIEICKKVLTDSNRDTKQIDFDDMVYLPVLLDFPIKKYDWVIIDEAQDTNAVRKLMAQRMLNPTSRFLAIGDDKQAIYGFTGAEADSMEIIKETFKCESYTLPICYRCDTSIINRAKFLVPDIAAREDAGEGVSRVEKYDDFVNKILDYNFTEDDGIVCRNNAPIVSLAFKFIRRGIGCRIEGRDIGKSLINLCGKWKKITCINEFTTKLVSYFDKEFEKATRVKMQILEDKMQTMIVLIERATELGYTKVTQLQDLIDGMFSDYGDKGLPKVVTLSSIHKAKGLEWKRCFMLGNDSLIPSKYAVMGWQQEQEDNLKYVAITRAMHELVDITGIPSRSNAEE